MSTAGSEALDTMRLDKWLWAARFFKTRSLATEAVNGGKVQVDGARIKPARKIRAGSRLTVRRGPIEWEVLVTGLSERRLPAKAAQELYEESADSITRRQAEAEQRRQKRAEHPFGVGRPTKRDRRSIEKLKRSGD